MLEGPMNAPDRFKLRMKKPCMVGRNCVPIIVSPHSERLLQRPTKTMAAESMNQISRRECLNYILRSRKQEIHHTASPSTSSNAVRDGNRRLRKSPHPVA
jgi:hypothetical protein